MPSIHTITLGFTLFSFISIGCDRAETTRSTAPANSHSAMGHPVQATTPSSPTVAAADASPAPAPDGPRAVLTDPRYRLVAELTDGTGENPAMLNVELRGAEGYHVNDLYPIALDLDVRNGQAPKPTMRRADAAEFSQAVARFTTPVQNAGPGTEVTGRLRFAVCTAENCVPETRNFAVALR